MHFDAKLQAFRTTWMQECIDRFYGSDDIDQVNSDLTEEMLAEIEEAFGDDLSPFAKEDIVNSIVEDAREYAMAL